MNPLHRWLSEPGFLGTGAARGSDLLLLGLLLLAALVAVGLHAARRGFLRRHALCMGGATLILLLVVTVFTGWTRAGGLRGGRPVARDLMGLHLALATGGLVLLPVTVSLGGIALAARRGRIRALAWPRRHRALGYGTALLLGATALTGILVYALRYRIRA